MRLLSKTFAVLCIAWLASFGAQAQECKEIDTLISTSYFLSGCTSPFGLCTAGTVAGGPLAGTTRFVVLTLGQGASPAELVYTGELVITTKHGSVTVHDSGVFNQVTGKYFELQQIISGTKKFEHATGALTSGGIGTTTGFSGRLTGEVCRGEEHAEEAEGRSPKAE